MFFPKVSTPENTRESISVFGGYHRADRIADGEFYDMKNLCSDHYPLMGPRKKRTTVLNVAKSPTEYIGTVTPSGYDSSLSKVKVRYRGKVYSNGSHPYVFAYTISTDIASAVITCTQYDGEGKELAKESFQTLLTGNLAYEFETGADTINAVIEVEAQLGNASSFDEELMNTYLTGTVYRFYDEVRGMLCKDGKLAYLLAQSLFYDGKFYDLSGAFPYGDDRNSPVQLLSFNTQILIFPMGIWFNTLDWTFGTLAQRVEHSRIMTYTLCDLEGNAISATASQSEPLNPSQGDYWLCTKKGQEGLLMWDANSLMWQAIATTYVKIDVPGASEHFSEGDAVYMNTKYADINEGSIIEAIDENYIIVVGLIGAASDTEDFSEGAFVMERRIPQIDFACVSANRVWGCFKGEKDGEILNEIYASKLGDPNNWYYFDGTAVDSYAVSVGSDGDFTGAVAYQGYPTFFKEDVMYRIFGGYPAQYQLSTNECRGVQKGSSRSIAMVGSYLVYKAIAGVCVYDGSNPVVVSESLGSGTYYNAAAGGCKDKYYISMEDEEGNAHLFVYDIRRGLWHREDSLAITEFAYNRLGQLYGQDGMTIYGFGDIADSLKLKKGDVEDDVEWEAVTGYFGMSYERGKYTGLITIRARIPVKAEIIAEISVDDKPWEQKKIMRGEGRPDSYTVYTEAEYCDHYRLRLHGHGDVRIFSIVRHLEATDED